MPLNLLKTYNDLLDIGGLSIHQRKASLKGVFDKDITNNTSFKFRNKQITPTPKDGVISMETLYTHLTTVVIDIKTKKREFDLFRSKRLHWIKYHINLREKDNILVYSVKEPKGFRTYIYNVDEKYVIILEPLRKKDEYYLLTAYYVRGRDAEKDKFINKYKKRRLIEVL